MSNDPQLATIRRADREEPVIVLGDRVVPVRDLAPGFEGTALDVISEGQFTSLAAAAGDSAGMPWEDCTFTAPYRRPHKIWGIGLNYREHAADLAESVPEQPASFIKGDHTIIGPDEPIVLPAQSSRVTAEAELGLIIGRTCRNVDEDKALDYVWGVTTILDQTAEDILRLNPRYLTRAKNFPSFFCFGPTLTPLSSVLARSGGLEELEVSTVRNNRDWRSDKVANMTHGPAALVSFHSRMMPLFPGDIISTGTPGALTIADGDVMECTINGVGSLRTTVRAGVR
ncbi:fumarylacetoacetate hydrolase family protein [Streptomyces chartreusis]|uniref:fumarylacetoacetate hydrolase family protein n=1 Tax=Streptomyces chartreusis TaxID=1969 RepID=UPI0036A12408